MTPINRSCAWAAPLLLVAGLGNESLCAQEEASPDTVEINLDAITAPEVPEDSLNRGTPRGTVEGFLSAIENGDLETAAEYLDLRNLPRRYRDEDPQNLARELGVVMTREMWVDPEDLSEDPDGHSGDGLPAYRDELGLIETEAGEIVLLLQRVPRGDGVSIWKISNKTVAKIADLYEDFGYGPIVEAMAQVLPDVSLLGLELFKWVLGLGAAVLAYPFLLAASWVVTRILRRPGAPMYKRIFRFLAGPTSILIALLIGNWVVRNLGLGLTARKFAETQTLTTVVVTWLTVSLINLWRDAYQVRMQKLGRANAIVLIRPVTTTVKSVVIVAAFLVWLDNVGFDITALLAGLGVGGVAVALALQKPMEDVFGAFTLFTQQPIHVGDLCRFGGNQMGRIEDIGLRTTRIRTLSNTVVAMPNARFAAEYIENVSARKKMLHQQILRLRYDTPPETVEKVLEGVRLLLEEHPRVLEEKTRVRFRDFAPDALALELYAFFDCRTIEDYLEVAEEINLGVLRVVADAGTSLAPPSRTLQIEERGGKDDSRGEKSGEI